MLERRCSHLLTNLDLLVTNDYANSSEQFVQLANFLKICIECSPTNEAIMNMSATSLGMRVHCAE